MKVFALHKEGFQNSCYLICLICISLFTIKMFVNRKVEDLQFTIEEQSINQDEVEVGENLFSLKSSQIFLFAN